MSPNLENLSVLLSGQLITSRTETIEEYLKPRVKTLGVIGLTGVYAAENVSRCSLYEKGMLKQEFSLASILIKKRNILSQLLLVPAFILYFISITKASYKFKVKFDIFLGVACFSTFVGVFLKKMGKIRHLIYYCIDYYPYPKRFCFNTLVVWAFRKIDKFCVKNSDIVWHIAKRIPEARRDFEGVKENSYNQTLVPLCYNSAMMRRVAFEDIERWTIGFVGTLSENQGLQLLIKSMPRILQQLPEVKVKIIGRGPYVQELRKLVEQAKLEDVFDFLGFIKDDNKVLDILSHCAIGIAPWTSSSEDNIQFADPGKPKLYAFCSLPIIITNGAISIADEIKNKKAGLSINYEEHELAQAVVSLLKDENNLKIFRRNALEFANSYTSENIFEGALRDSLVLMRGNH